MPLSSYLPIKALRLLAAVAEEAVAAVTREQLVADLLAHRRASLQELRRVQAIGQVEEA